MTEAGSVSPEIITRETPVWRRALRGALGSAATAFVVMEGGVLLAKFISGETTLPGADAHFASGLGALLLAVKGARKAVLEERIQPPLPIRLIRSAEMGAIFAISVTVLFAIGERVAGVNRMTTENGILVISLFTSNGLMDGWFNVRDRIMPGFKAFTGRSIMPFKS